MVDASPEPDSVAMAPLAASSRAATAAAAEWAGADSVPRRGATMVAGSCRPGVAQVDARMPAAEEAAGCWSVSFTGAGMRGGCSSTCFERKL